MSGCSSTVSLACDPPPPASNAMKSSWKSSAGAASGLEGRWRLRF
jgi:hypothetical protein